MVPRVWVLLDVVPWVRVLLECGPYGEGVLDVVPRVRCYLNVVTRVRMLPKCGPLGEGVTGKTHTAELCCVTHAV